MTQGVSTYFRGFSASELERLVSVMCFYRVPKGEDVIVKGQCATFFCILLQGLLSPEAPSVMDTPRKTASSVRAITRSPPSLKAFSCSLMPCGACDDHARMQLAQTDPDVGMPCRDL